MFPASSVTSFVGRPHPDSEIIEVRGNSIRGIDVLVDGVLLDFDSAISDVIIAAGNDIMKITNKWR